MRFDKPVYFQSVTPGAYDPATGNHEADAIIEHMEYASVSNASVETLNLVYGEIRQGSFVVRLLNHYTGKFDRIRIGSKRYRVDYRKDLRTKQMFVVSEVQ